RQDGTIWRNGGWEQYRAMAGLPDDQLLHHADHGHATVIDDWTEDLDYPADWDGWCWRWAHTDPAHRPTHHTTTPRPDAAAAAPPAPATRGAPRWQTSHPTNAATPPPTSSPSPSTPTPP